MYGRLLSDDFRRMSSRQFEAHIKGLFSADTRVNRYFAPKEDPHGR